MVYFGNLLRSTSFPLQRQFMSAQNKSLRRLQRSARKPLTKAILPQSDDTNWKAKPLKRDLCQSNHLQRRWCSYNHLESGTPRHLEVARLRLIDIASVTTIAGDYVPRDVYMGLPLYTKLYRRWFVKDHDQGLSLFSLSPGEGQGTDWLP